MAVVERSPSETPKTQKTKSDNTKRYQIKFLQKYKGDPDAEWEEIKSFDEIQEFEKTSHNWRISIMNDIKFTIESGMKIHHSDFSWFKTIIVDNNDTKEKSIEQMLLSNIVTINEINLDLDAELVLCQSCWKPIKENDEFIVISINGNEIDMCNKCLSDNKNNFNIQITKFKRSIC